MLVEIAFCWINVPFYWLVLFSPTELMTARTDASRRGRQVPLKYYYIHSGDVSLATQTKLIFLHFYINIGEVNNLSTLVSSMMLNKSRSEHLPSLSCLLILLLFQELKKQNKKTLEFINWFNKSKKLTFLGVIL